MDFFLHFLISSLSIFYLTLLLREMVASIYGSICIEFQSDRKLLRRLNSIQHLKISVNFKFHIVREGLFGAFGNSSSH